MRNFQNRELGLLTKRKIDPQLSHEYVLELKNTNEEIITSKNGCCFALMVSENRENSSKYVLHWTSKIQNRYLLHLLCNAFVRVKINIEISSLWNESSRRNY